jgi:hypothetical protein
MSEGESVLEVRARISTGAAAGLTSEPRQHRQIARQVGRRGIEGRLHAARGAVELRERSNWIDMRLEPSELTEVISVTPAISPRRRSKGAAIVAAMVSGSAPGRLAETLMVANSTDGRLATGRKR